MWRSKINFIALFKPRLALRVQVIYRSVGTAGRMTKRFAIAGFVQQRALDKWTGLQRLQLVTRPTHLTKDHTKGKAFIALNNQLCNNLELHGYHYSDVAKHWEDIPVTSSYQLRWTTMLLMAEDKELSVENLLKACKEVDPLSDENCLPTNPTYDECLTKLSTMLRNRGGSDKAITDLIDMLRSHEIPEYVLIHECKYAIEVSKLLMDYLHTLPNTIVSEYSCLLRIAIPQLFENWQHIKSMGINSPGNVFNYLTGIYVRQSNRPVVSSSTSEVCEMLGLSIAEANCLNFTRAAIIYLLQTIGFSGISSRFSHLLNAGYLRRDVASVPFILYFPVAKISKLLDEQPEPFKTEFEKASNQCDELLVVFNELDRADGYKISNFQVNRQQHKLRSNNNHISNRF